MKGELCGKSHAAHHAQRVVRKGDVGIKGGADDAVFYIVKSIEGINEFAKSICIQANRYGVDGEITAVLVVLQCAVFYNGLSAVTIITFTACANKFNFLTFPLHLGGAKISEYAEVAFIIEFFGKGLSHCDAATNNDNINVF